MATTPYSWALPTSESTLLPRLLSDRSQQETCTRAVTEGTIAIISLGADGPRDRSGRFGDRDGEITRFDSPGWSAAAFAAVLVVAGSCPSRGPRLHE